MADIKQIQVGNTNYNISGAAIVLEDNSTTTAGTWLAKTNQINSLEDGQIFLYKITKAGASTTTLNITGSGGTALGAKTIYRNATVKLTTHYGVGEYILLTYNALNTCFRVVNDCDANSTSYVRYDTNTQGLNDTQKANARTNIGAGTSNLTIGTTSTTAAAGNHTHTTSLATDSGTSTVNMAANTTYKLTTGGTSVIFKTPADTNTASAVDNILDGSNNGTAITYAPYSAQQSKLSFDTSTTTPTRTDRLNLNGKFYATEVYAGSTKLTGNTGTVTSVSAGTGLSISGTASVNPTVNVASGYKLPTTTEWGSKVDKSSTVIEIDDGLTNDIKNAVTADCSIILFYDGYYYVPQYGSHPLPNYYNCFEGDSDTFRYLVINWANLTFQAEEVGYVTTQTVEDNYQEKLTPGTGISIDDNVISATNNGTVTSVALANDTNGGLTVSSGSPVTTSGTIKVKHSNILSASGTIGSSSASSGATLSVPYANYDINGHITSKGTHTHTINNLTSSAINSSYKLPTTTEWGNKLENVNSFTKTWEYNFADNNGNSSNGFYIGDFPMGDSNITIEISATIGVAAYGTLVIAAQNINTSRGGTYQCLVFGDYNNLITPNIRIQYNSGSTNFKIYFIPLDGYCKMFFHIRAQNTTAEPDIKKTSVSSVPTSNLLDIENAYYKYSGPRNEFMYNSYAIDAMSPEVTNQLDTYTFTSSGLYLITAYLALNVSGDTFDMLISIVNQNNNGIAESRGKACNGGGLNLAVIATFNAGERIFYYSYGYPYTSYNFIHRLQVLKLK